jgi:hypothetical protein
MTNLAMKEQNLKIIDDLKSLKELYGRISKLNNYDDIKIILQRLPDSDLKSLYYDSLDCLNDLKNMLKYQKIAINLYRKEVDRRNRERTKLLRVVGTQREHTHKKGENFRHPIPKPLILF